MIEETGSILLLRGDHDIELGRILPNIYKKYTNKQDYYKGKREEINREGFQHWLIILPENDCHFHFLISLVPDIVQVGDQ